VSPILVAPDTSLLLAIGYGAEVDPRANQAIETLNRVIESGATAYLLGSVRDELEQKLSEIAAVYPTLQVLSQELEARSEPLTVEEVEPVMVHLKSRAPERIVRYLEAFEAQIVDLVRANPAATAAALVPTMLAAAVHLETAVRARIDTFRLVPFEIQASTTSTVVTIPGIGTGDNANLRTCEALGASRDSQVLFVVFDSALHARQYQIRDAFPHVVVTTPLYLGRHLDDSPG
jgi:hypothetical protein